MGRDDDRGKEKELNRKRALSGINVGSALF
jgi:hypothetical protein